jgi:biofilm protein TabA
MILDVLTNSDRYRALHQGFAEAFTFLRRPDLKDLAVDRYVIDGDNVFAIVAKDPGRHKDEAQLETHEKYIDIQLVLNGIDDMGWRPKSLCLLPGGEYDPEEDILFFADTPMVRQPVSPGMFAVFFPEDAHQPLIAEGQIHKVVVKVAVDRR